MAYGDDSGFQAYCVARGYNLSAATPQQRDTLRQIGSTFVDGLGWRMVGDVPISRFPGQPTDPTQAEQWPRTNATDTYGNVLADDAVPAPVERAAYEAAFYEDQNPGGLNDTVRADQTVVREKFGSVEFQYAEGRSKAAGMTSTAPVIPVVMTHLAPVLLGGANAYGVTMVTG